MLSPDLGIVFCPLTLALSNRAHWWPTYAFFWHVWGTTHPPPHQPLTFALLNCANHSRPLVAHICLLLACVGNNTPSTPPAFDLRSVEPPREYGRRHFLRKCCSRLMPNQ